MKKLTYIFFVSFFVFVTLLDTHAQNGGMLINAVNASEEIVVGPTTGSSVSLNPSHISLQPLSASAINSLVAQEGALIYNTSSDIIMYYDGSEWVGPQPPAAPAPPAAPVCPATVGDYDGNYYKVVQIDGKCWMAEDLKVTHYSNGTAITHMASGWGLMADDLKAYCVYNDDGVPGNNGDIYGALYTWSAVMNDVASSDAIPSGVQGVCPTGWHVPSSAEFLVLADFLGGASVAGDKLKEGGNEHWTFSSGSSPTNESGFNALPGGFRFYFDGFSGINSLASIWTCTENGNGIEAKFCGLEYDQVYVTFDVLEYKSGLSVRCIQNY